MNIRRFFLLFILIGLAYSPTAQAAQLSVYNNLDRTITRFCLSAHESGAYCWTWRVFESSRFPVVVRDIPPGDQVDILFDHCHTDVLMEVRGEDDDRRLHGVHICGPDDSLVFPASRLFPELEDNG